MTEKLYLEDSYMRDFDATVKSVDGKYVVLDRSAFYPRGGGQPHDEGKILTQDGEEYDVKYAIKKDGDVSLEVDDEGLEEGERVKGKLDWERRYKLMRYHTASHVLSSVVYDRLGAKITGNKIYTHKLRVDYGLDSFDRDLFKDILSDVNDILAKDLEVETYYMKREDVLEKDMIKLEDSLPPDIEELRIVKIGDVDEQPDGGTHVKSTGEVGTLRFSDYKNKGKNNKRVYVKLDP